MKVTILIPCFNSAHFITKTLDSVLGQTTDDWKCIIIDDHSTDNSLEIINSYCAKYPEKFSCFINPGKGACAARNHAFEKSTGDFIQYLDADDLLSPNKLEEQMKLFNQFGDNIVTNCKWGRFTHDHELVKWEEQSIDKNYENPIDWLADSWMGNGMAQTAVWLTPRHLIEKAGPWDEGLQINQDGEFFCRVLMQAQCIKFSEAGGVYYRSGLAGSITHANSQSRGKAESLLQSYKSYELVLSVQKSETIRKALGNNYLNFIYQFSALYPELAEEAVKSFYGLGFQKMWPVGGNFFKKLSNLIGFKNALRIKSFVDAK